MKLLKKITSGLLIAATLALCVGLCPLASVDAVRAEETFTAKPLTITSDAKRDKTEDVTYTLPAAASVTGNYFALKLYVKNASLPTVYLHCALKDGKGETKEIVSFTGLRAVDLAAEGNVVLTSLNKTNNFIEVPYGFYGYVYIPFSSFSSPAAVSSVTVGFGAQSLGYDSLLEDIQNVYVFGAYDVTLDLATCTESSRNTIVDYTALEPSAVTQTENAVTQIKKATDYDMQSLQYAYAHKTDECARIGDVKIAQNFDLNASLSELDGGGAATDRRRTFSRMGQNSDITFVPSGLAGGGEMLSYRVADDRVGDANAYASVHFNLAYDAQDWSGAKGVTVYVENPGMAKYSFGVEIFLYNTKTGKTEQYNLNPADGASYRKVYAYNVETGEEFSYNTQMFVRVPANFKGWLRIPFSEFQAPAWTKAEPYNNQGVFDTENYKVTKISFSRIFTDNAASTLFFDDLGAYYSDFSVGGMFDFSGASKPSMKQCLQGVN